MINFAQLKYKRAYIIAGVVLLGVGGSIYVLPGKRYITEDEVVELIQGIIERSMATIYDFGSVQTNIATLTNAVWTNDPSGAMYTAYDTNGVAYSTNYLIGSNTVEVITNIGRSFSYRVGPHEHFSTYTEVAGKKITGYSTQYQGTNIIAIYTNDALAVLTKTSTNLITIYVESNLLSSVDNTIKLLIPQYVNTNLISNGMTIIDMLTVTGVFAALNIGDGTNQFTQETPRTNLVETNFWVIYTNFFPNGVATTNSYTSTVDQTVNYAASWDGINYIWTNRTGWPTAISTISTTAVVYGGWPWTIEKASLIERYKVLNYLKKTTASMPSFTRWKRGTNITFVATWTGAVAEAESNFHANLVVTNRSLYAGVAGGVPVHLSVWTWGRAAPLYQTWIVNSQIKAHVTNICDEMEKTVDFYWKFDTDSFDYWTNKVDDGNGVSVFTNAYKLISTVDGGTSSYVIMTNWFGMTNIDTVPNWVAEPPANHVFHGLKSGIQTAIVDWGFSYCTNSLP